MRPSDSEYAGPRTPSQDAFDKAVSILNSIKDDVHVRNQFLQGSLPTDTFVDTS